ncbi:MAG TPA: alpha/beta hydrolase [Salinimicrobium sp.]|nr:alpha/beta hydrolase [Salinimicrobium sp.]
MKNQLFLLPFFAFLSVFAQIDTVQEKNSLPQPTGKFATGTIKFEIIDENRESLFDKTKNRTIIGQVWYPSNFTSGATANYLDPAVVDYMVSIGYFGLDSTTIENFNTVKTNSILNSPIREKATKLPVIFFVHGLGVSKNFYTTYYEEMASQGYFVIALDHPFGGVTATQNKRILSYKQDTLINSSPEILMTRIDQWSKDIKFIYEKLKNPSSEEFQSWSNFIDLEKIAVVGHSLGGNVALGIKKYIPEVDAAINMDGGSYENVKDGLMLPSMIIRSFPVYSDEELAEKGRTREEWDQMGKKIDSLHYSLFENSKTEEIYYVKIEGTGHMSFSDAPYVSPFMITRFGGKILDKEQTKDKVLNLVISFLNQELKREKAVFLESKPEHMIIEKF